jgi:hypothetical protein
MQLDAMQNKPLGVVEHPSQAQGTPGTLQGILGTQLPHWKVLSASITTSSIPCGFYFMWFEIQRSHITDTGMFTQLVTW